MGRLGGSRHGLQIGRGVLCNWSLLNKSEEHTLLTSLVDQFAVACSTQTDTTCAARTTLNSTGVVAE
eukprot:4905797-Amphidinium_carterae.1